MECVVIIIVQHLTFIFRVGIIFLRTLIQTNAHLMGSWGTAISSNDTYTDIHNNFFDRYNEGMDVPQISQLLIAENQDVIHDTDDANNFWFALAKSQWECKALDKEIYDLVKQIIESGDDLKVWEQLGADKKDLEKRKVVLEKFLMEISVEKQKAKSRKKKKILQPVFEKGDCIAFKLENGNYGGAVVLEAIRDTEYGYNLIVATRINQSAKPTTKDFETAEVLIVNYETFNDKPAIHWYMPMNHHELQTSIEVIGQINIEHSFDKATSKIGIVSYLDIWVVGMINKQFQHELSNARPSLKQTIRELSNKH